MYTYSFEAIFRTAKTKEDAFLKGVSRKGNS